MIGSNTAWLCSAVCTKNCSAPWPERSGHTRSLETCALGGRAVGVTGDPNWNRLCWIHWTPNIILDSAQAAAWDRDAIRAE